MKRFFLPTLTATLLLFSACTNQPSPSAEPVIDPTLPKVSINGHIESMTTVAFEWKPVKNQRVRGYYVYRSTPDQKDPKLTRHATLETRFLTHYVDKDLKPNTNYVYRFSTFNEKKQESDTSKTFRVTTKPVINSVSFFEAVGNLPRMAKLIWRPHENPSVNSYIIERQVVEKPEWTEIAKIDNRLQAEYIDRDLDDNRVYKYRLRAVTFNGIKSTPSDIAKLITKPLPLATENLKASTNLAKKISITWNKSKENDIDFYNVYRASSGDGSYSYLAKLNETKFIDEVKEDGKSYFYKVTAVDKDGLEGMKQSVPVNGLTLAKPYTPTFSDAIIKDSSAVLSWKNNDSRTKTYTVIKTTKTSWINSTIQEISNINDTTYTDKDLQPNIQYQYQVMAVDEFGVTSEPTEKVDVSFSTPNR